MGQTDSFIPSRGSSAGLCVTWLRDDPGVCPHVMRWKNRHGKTDFSPGFSPIFRIRRARREPSGSKLVGEQERQTEVTSDGRLQGFQTSTHTASIRDVGGGHIFWGGGQTEATLNAETIKEIQEDQILIVINRHLNDGSPWFGLCM